MKSPINSSPRLQCDHEELRNVLKQKGAKGTTEDAKSADMFLRLKCTLTSRGRNVNIKSASFKVSFSGALNKSTV